MNQHLVKENTVYSRRCGCQDLEMSTVGIHSENPEREKRRFLQYLAVLQGYTTHAADNLYPSNLKVLFNNAKQATMYESASSK